MRCFCLNVRRLRREGLSQEPIDGTYFPSSLVEEKNQLTGPNLLTGVFGFSSNVFYGASGRRAVFQFSV